MIRTYSSRYNRHRTGQALLLAVLVMVFAALIGVTFITVVAINVGQTGREEERDKARQAAEAGLAFANLQLTNGIRGIRWRPEQEIVTPGTPAPIQGPPVATNVFYWTPFDQAQGWAGYNGTCTNAAGVCEGNFVKFPDPRSTNPTLNAPNYMLKVEKILPNDPQGDNEADDKTGGLRITSIGLSPDDPNVFYKVVAYKGGLAQQPGTRGAMEVTNWDFQDEIVPVAQAVAGSGVSLDVANLKGAWPPVPFYIMRGDPAHGGTVERHVVTAVGGSTLTLATTTPIATAVTAGERVEVAAALGAPLAIDYNADGTADTTLEQVNFELSKPTIPGVAYTSIPGSTYVNGGLILQGNAKAQRLRAPSLASATQIPGAVRSTGLMYTSGTTQITGNIDDGSATAVSGTLQSSNGAGFPFTGGGTQEQRIQLVEDGWNRLAGSSDPSRQIKPFTPPDITSGGQGFGRYRQLTKYSIVDTALYSGASPQAAAYGYGQGVYINNPQDRERKRSGTAGRYIDMTQADLMRLWYSSETASGNSALRLSEPSETIPTSAQSDTDTLEEMHLRGWVAPNEFLARGALIEIDPVNALVHITLDSRNDGKANPHANGATTVYPYQGSTPNKGWRDIDGSLDGDATVGGVYRKSLPWPANGVIFAEGNIRVRGGAFDPSGNTDLTVIPPRSLTIVSMNNIYIEGSLNAGARKVMLLAKKNVLMNPTAAIQKAEVQTRLDGAAGGTDITVHDASGFLPGDEIVIGASSERATVQAVLGPTSLRLTAAPSGGGNSEIVKLVDDPLRLGNRVYHQYATRITQFRDAVQRRVFLQGANTELRLAVRHSAERREALSVTTVQADTAHPSTPPALQSATVANKLARSIQTTIIQPDHTTPNLSEKQFETEYTDAAASGVARFPDPLHLSETAAMAFPVGNDAVAADGLAGALNDARSAPLWHYSASGINGYHQLSGTAPHATRPPAHFLAAVGNKPDILPADPTDTTTYTYPYRKGIFIQDGITSRRSYNIPMATSVVMNLNGLQQAFRSDYYNGALSNFEFVKQFGFNFTFGIGAASDVTTWEDVLTADQTFYRNNTLTTAANFAYDNVPYVLDARTVKDLDTSSNNTTQGWNTLAFKFDPQTESYFDPTFPSTANTASMPYYRLSRLKIENANQLNASNEFEILEPGYTFDVRAYIYAQEGSWLVLSGGYYDEHIRTNASGEPYLDKPDAAGVYNGTHDAATENADLNRDGVETRAEKVAAYRYRRYNYQVNITGAIMQKTTPVIDDPDGTGPMVGYVSDWMDKWATVTTTARNFDNSPTLPFNPATMRFDTDPALNNFATISYTYDPAAALGVVDSDIVDEDRNNNGILDPGEDLNLNGRLDKPGFVPAVSSELIYQTG